MGRAINILNTQQAVHTYLTPPSPHVTHTMLTPTNSPPLPGQAHWTVLWSNAKVHSKLDLCPQ